MRFGEPPICYQVLSVAFTDQKPRPEWGKGLT